MKLKFVTEEEINKLPRGRGPAKPYAEFIEELYKHPNRWAEFPEKISSSSSIATIRKRFKDIDVKMSGGNQLPVDHPDKKNWTLYLRYTPSETVEEETF